MNGQSPRVPRPLPYLGQMCLMPRPRSAGVFRRCPSQSERLVYLQNSLTKNHQNLHLVVLSHAGYYLTSYFRSAFIKVRKNCRKLCLRQTAFSRVLVVRRSTWPNQLVGFLLGTVLCGNAKLAFSSGIDDVAEKSITEPISSENGELVGGIGAEEENRKSHDIGRHHRNRPPVESVPMRYGVAGAVGVYIGQ